MKKIFIISIYLLGCLTAWGATPETAATLLRKARKSMQDYDFATAATRYNAYQASLKKAGQPADSLAREENSAIPRLKNALERVEDLVIFDSINIPLITLGPADTLSIENYRSKINENRYTALINSMPIPYNSGRFCNASDVDFIQNSEAIDGPVFINADGNTALWSAPGPRELNVLYEGTRLADGTWQTDIVADIPAPAYAPFLLDDGLTLYYISDNHQTLGGRDVMMSTRDGIAGAWRQPQNIGMPYNSPFDELLFAIDTNDSIGWLASTRNFLDGDSATIYFFVPSDTRHNLNGEEADLISRARINAIADTWPDGFSPEVKKNIIRNIPLNTPSSTPADFHLYLPDGNLITRYSDLKNEKARKAMMEYLTVKEKVSRAEIKLKGMYDEYGSHSTDNNMEQSIRQAEEQLDYLRADAERKLNRVYKYLGFK